MDIYCDHPDNYQPTRPLGIDIAPQPEDGEDVEIAVAPQPEESDHVEIDIDMSAPQPEELIQQEQDELNEEADDVVDEADDVVDEAEDAEDVVDEAERGEDNGEVEHDEENEDGEQAEHSEEAEHAEHNEEAEPGFELSEDNIDVDGDGVYSNAEEDDSEDSDFDIDAQIGFDDYSSSEDEAEIEAESSTRVQFRDVRKAKKKLPNFQEFKESDLKSPSFKLGMVFQTGKLFKDAVRQYAIQAGKDVYFKKNDPSRIRAECKQKSCNWTIFASLLGKTGVFIVKTYRPEHTCPRVNKNRFASSAWLARTYMQQFKDSESWSASDFMNRVQKDLILECSRVKAYRAKKEAARVIEGSYKEQYAKLWDYGAELESSNPGSTIKFESETGADGKPVFKRMYVCFQGCKAGFKYCRPILGFDGCHIKGHHTGQLLTAIGIDANNSIFPVAYAVVESECKVSWTWFFSFLKDDLGIVNGHHWTFISDKQKRLQEALSDMWEEGLVHAEHRHCARHLQSNFTKVSQAFFILLFI